MSYAKNNQGLGETYKVNLPVVGESNLTIPTSQIADDLMRSLVVSFDRNRDRFVVPVMDAMAARAPELVDSTYPYVKAKLDEFIAEKDKEIQRKMWIAGGAFAAAIVGYYGFKRLVQD